MRGRGCAWQGGMCEGVCMTGGMHGRRACVVGGLPGRGVCMQETQLLKYASIEMHSCFK